MKPYYQDDFVTIYHADCREVLPSIEGDVVLTDPPFNVGKDYGATDDALSDEVYAELMGTVASGADRQAWVTPTNRLNLFSTLLGDVARPVVIRRGAKGPKRWGWFDQFDMLLVRGYPLRYETNLWDGIRLKGEGYFFREESYGHPGYTPYALMSKLVGLMASPTDLVVEPFAGTGTTLVAAKALRARAIGIEIEERYCEIAAKRLAQGVLWGAQ